MLAEPDFHKLPTLVNFGGVEEVSPPLPTEIGPYKIEGLLSRGGMSLLYLGIDPATKRPLAIKVLSPKYVSHPEGIALFIKEAQLIGLSDHPHIVKLYGQGEWEGGLYIAMELVRGVSLRQFIVQHSFSLRRSLDIILQVAEALCHLHAHGVIHRDLKPENILITEEGKIKVIDFGIAQLHEEGQIPAASNSSALGTPAYMAPELKQAPHAASYSSDIYSLGVIAYELILGKLSFGTIDLGRLPKGLGPIISKALAVSPHERYEDIVDFMSDITKYIKSGTLEKDRRGQDQFKELLEALYRGSKNISFPHLPAWPHLDMGMAQLHMLGQQLPYTDFFKLPDGNLLILLATAACTTADAAIYLGVLRGMVHMAFKDTAKSFDPLSFITSLARTLRSDSLRQQFGLSLLFLDPTSERLLFSACGAATLLHLPQASSSSRRLTASNPPLGAPSDEIYIDTRDSWGLGDTLVLLPPYLQEPPFAVEQDQLLGETLKENGRLSAQHQAEILLKKASAFHSGNGQQSPKSLLVLQRIS